MLGLPSTSCNLQIVIDRAHQTGPGSDLEVSEGMVLGSKDNLSGGAMEMGVEPWSSGPILSWDFCHSLVAFHSRSVLTSILVVLEWYWSEVTGLGLRSFQPSHMAAGLALTTDFLPGELPAAVCGPG